MKARFWPTWRSPLSCRVSPLSSCSWLIVSLGSRSLLISLLSNATRPLPPGGRFTPERGIPTNPPSWLRLKLSQVGVTSELISWLRRVQKSEASGTGVNRCFSLFHICSTP